MTAPRSRRFSKATVAALTQLLRHHNPTQTVSALQVVADRFAQHQRTARTMRELRRRARFWSKGVQQRVRDLQTYLASLQHRDEAVMFTGGPLDLPECQRFIDTLRPLEAVSTEETDRHVTPPGTAPLPRFLLNIELALVLKHAGVPLQKSRQGLAHQVFVEVYTSLGLTRGGGDVFHALEQGVTLTEQFRRFRLRRVRRSSPKLS